MKIFCCLFESKRPNSSYELSSTQLITSTESSKKTSSSTTNLKPLIMPEMESINPEKVGKKCLVLDLDETLVHSSFQVIITYL